MVILLLFLSACFNIWWTLTFKNKIFLLLQVLMVDSVLLCFAGCKNSLSSPWKFPSVNILVWNSQVYLPGFFFWWERHRRPLAVSFLQPESDFRVPHCVPLIFQYSSKIPPLEYMWLLITPKLFMVVFLFLIAILPGKISKSFSSPPCLNAPWHSHWVPCLPFWSLLLIQFPQFTGGACILVSRHLALNSSALKSSQVSWSHLTSILDKNVRGSWLS